jgi:hypothetical protein
MTDFRKLFGGINPEFDPVALANGCATSSAPTGTDAASILASIMALKLEMAAHGRLNEPALPDKNGNVYPASLFGMPLVVSPLLPTTRQVAHMRERKWSHRVRFQKERRFDITYETKPNNEVYVLADKIVLNQQQFDALEATIPKSKEPTFSMGMSVRPHDYVPMEPEPRFHGFGAFDINPRSVALIRGGV